MKKVTFYYDLMGEKLYSLRVNQNLSLSDAAKGLGFSPLFLQQVEKGQQTIALDEVIRLCNFYQIKIDDLLSYKIMH